MKGNTLNLNQTFFLKKRRIINLDASICLAVKLPDLKSFNPNKVNLGKKEYCSHLYGDSFILKNFLYCNLSKFFPTIHYLKTQIL